MSNFLKSSVHELPTNYVVERVAAADTIVDGVCVWFEALFDEDTILSTSPLAPITSWGNRMFRLDCELSMNEHLRLHVHMGQLVDPSTWGIEVL